jgi:glycine cleavage system aminomethyltransferase T
MALRSFGGGLYAVRAGSEEDDRRASQRLGLCDLSGLRKFGLQGPDAHRWLADEGLDVPGDVFASCSLPGGGVVVRMGTNEFFLEENISSSAFPALAARIDSFEGRRLRVEHQEATFLLTGRCCLDVLAQTCAIDFRAVAPQKVIFTRVAGVNCGVHPESLGDLPAYRLWVDASYAEYLWETLAEICESLDGGAIGANCIYPELPA